jgi:molecular chaperone DnaK
LIHATRSAIKDNGDKVGGDLIGRAEAAIADVETAMKGDDKAKIEAATQKLAESAHKLAEQMYAQEQASQGQAQGQPGAGQSAGAGAGTQSSQQQDDGNVVDAEYEEVKDKK